MADELEAHPYANLFPMMGEAELAALAEDIAANGLQQPIVRYQGKVLDGRNRLAACEKAGVEPTFTDYEGDNPLALVVSLNALRRDLTASQRAIVAAKAIGPFSDEAKKRQLEAGEEGVKGGRGKKKNPPDKSCPEGLKSDQRARNQVAAIFKVNHVYVQQAIAIVAESPELADDVLSCRLLIGAAYEEKLPEIRAEKERQREVAALIEPYGQEISDGIMTPEEALAKAREEKRLAEEKRQTEEREAALKLAAITDTRRTWLKELARMVAWTERHVAEFDDDYLAWYNQSDAPGWFEHGVTAKRLRGVINQIQRVITFTIGEDNGQSDS